jgi:hypothetical protein
MKLELSGVGGTFEQQYEPLVLLFQQQGAAQPAGGSSLAVYKDGVSVVNVWQGQASADKAWSQETVSDVFSCTKGVVSILIARLIEDGSLDPEQKVSFYWPEFAQGGKAEVKVKTVLEHRAGLSATRRKLSYEEVLDGHTLLDELAKQEPLWQPDTAHAYHALTYGHLTSKLIHSVTGLNASEYLKVHVATPLSIDLWIGTPAEKLGQVATLISDGNFKSANGAPESDSDWVERAMTFGGGLPIDPTHENGFNDPRTLAIELAGANGITNANGLAKTYSAAVTETNGIRLLTDSAIRASSVPAAFGENYWHEPAPYASRGFGFMLPVPGLVEMPGAEGFGHDGLGGQAGWGSIETRVGFGYTTTYLKNTPETQKNQQDLVKQLQLVLKQQ